MLFIESLEEKIEIKDTDIMIIEDDEDTKKVTVGNLKKAITVSSDKKIESVKESIINDLSVSDQVIKDKLDAVSSAYYGLVRNYEFLNSAYEELKEMFTDYINKVNENNTSSNNISKVPIINDISTSNGSITLIWTGIQNVDGYTIVQSTTDENGNLQSANIEDFEISETQLETGTSNTVVMRNSMSEFKITINNLDVGTKYVYNIIAYTYDDNNERIEKQSTEKEIICK